MTNAAEATLTWGVVGVLIALMVLWSGVVMLAVRWILNSSEKHSDRRFAELQSQLALASAAHSTLHRQVHDLGVELPKEYVRREDWIRFSTMILASIDRVGASVDEELRAMRVMLETMAERKGD